MLTPPRLKPTPFWHQLSAYLGLSEALARAWWQALATSRWTLVCAWRQKLVLGERFVWVWAREILGLTVGIGLCGKCRARQAAERVRREREAHGQLRLCPEGRSPLV
jgi:hypothetical protein